MNSVDVSIVSQTCVIFSHDIVLSTKEVVAFLPRTASIGNTGFVQRIQFFNQVVVSVVGASSLLSMQINMLPTNMFVVLVNEILR